MQEILDQLTRVRGVGGCALFSPDGIPMASTLRNDVDLGRMAAAIATVISRAFGLCTRVQLGRPRLMHALGSDGGVVLLAAGGSFLAILVDPNANLALLQLEARPFVEAIADGLTL